MSLARNLLTGAAVLLVVSSSATALAQSTPAGTTPPPYPGGPPLLRPAESSVWQIDFAYAGDPKKSDDAKATPPPTPSIKLHAGDISMASPRQVVVTRSGKISRAVLRNIDGSETEQWADGQARFIVPKEGSAMFTLHDAAGNEMMKNYLGPDFPDLGWVSEKTYVGQATMANRPCLVFSQGNTTAWVDDESRYPLRWQQGTETRTFVQLPASEAALQLPPKVRALLEGIKRDSAILRRPVPPGG